MRGKRRKLDPRLVYGKASNYIHPLDRITPGTTVVLCCRVSYRHQKKAGNDADQEANLRAMVAARGGVVVAVVRYQGSGWYPSTWLPQAAALAAQHNAVLVAETTSRFIRNTGYRGGTKRNAKPTMVDLDRLQTATMGIELVTVTPPDAPAEVEHAFHTRRGQRGKGNLGGRPMRKKNRKNKLLPIVLRLWKDGIPVRQIEREIGVRESTLRGWLKDQ